MLFKNVMKVSEQLYHLSPTLRLSTWKTVSLKIVYSVVEN